MFCIINALNARNSSASTAFTGLFIHRLPPGSILDSFSGLNFAPEAVPPANPKPSLLHPEQHPARLDHHHQGQ